MAASSPKTPKVPLCFVIGPIGKDSSPERKHADLLLHAVIKHVLEDEEFGYKVKRADEDADPGMIGDRIISDIIHAELVVADLTDLNPNALYELGIRHATEKPTIHIAKAGTLLPFDTMAHRTIFVDLTDWHSTEQGRSRLARSARAIKEPEFRVSNPITQANASFEMRESSDPRDRVVAELRERIGFLETRLQGLRPARERPDVSKELVDAFVLRDLITGIFENRVTHNMTNDEIKNELRIGLAGRQALGDSYLDVSQVTENEDDATSLVVTVETAHGRRAFLMHRPTM
jgi:hypothetical protein